MKWPFVSLEKYEDITRKYEDITCKYDFLQKLYTDVVNNYKHIIDALKNKDKYYVCIDKDGLESENVYANNVYVDGDYFLFCTERETIAIMSREIWKDVVCREKETEEN